MSLYHQPGFALPTVLISSLVMFTVLLAAAAITATSRSALSDQYYNRLAKQAAESGLAYAEACLGQAETPPDWTPGHELRPHTNCDGETMPGASQYIVDTGKVVSTFAVGTAEIGSGAVTITSKATVDLVRSRNGTIWRSFEHTAKTQIIPGTEEVGFRQVAAGSSYSCSIATDDTVYCWGQGTYGRLGNNDSTESDQGTPVAVDLSALAGKSVAQLSAGDNHACLLTADNEAYCWGRGDYGQIGNGSTSHQLAPVRTATGGSMTGKTITQVVAGFRHTCALASDNTVHCWGYGISGQLGNGNTNSYSSPRAVITSGSLAGKTMTQLAAGVDHTCALASDGSVHCWGAGGVGQLGTGQYTNSLTPAAVDMSSSSLSGKAVAQIGVGGDTSRNRRFSCALATDGTVHCWGEGTYGRLGIGVDEVTHNKPTAVVMSGSLAGKHATQLSVGADHSCVVASDRDGYCWGRGSNGRLGNNSAVTQTAPDKVDMTGAMAGKDMIQITAGDNHTCAVASDYTAYCWGVDTNGRLGHGGPVGSHQFNPRAVSRLPIDVIPTVKLQF